MDKQSYYNMKAHDTSLTMKLPKELKEDFEALATKKGYKVSHLIRFLMIEWMSKEETK